MNEILKIIIGLLGVVCGFLLFKKILNKHRMIDTESIAVVKEIIDLGRDNGRRVYAIKYDILSNDPFELLETPCKKTKKRGTRRSVFYEKNNPKQNYYFKTIYKL